MLTRNEMTVRQMLVGDDSSVSGAGYEPAGKFRMPTVIPR